MADTIIDLTIDRANWEKFEAVIPDYSKKQMQQEREKGEVPIKIKVRVGGLPIYLQFHEPDKYEVPKAALHCAS